MKIDATPEELVAVLRMITAQPDEVLELRSQPADLTIERTIEDLRAQLHGEYLSPAHKAAIKVTREGELQDGFRDAVDEYLREQGDQPFGTDEREAMASDLAVVLMSVVRAHGLT